VPIEPQFSTQKTVAEAGTQTVSEDRRVEVGTQTTITRVIAPLVNDKKQWTRKATGPHPPLVREEEEKERFDQEVGPLTTELESQRAQTGRRNYLVPDLSRTLRLTKQLQLQAR